MTFKVGTDFGTNNSTVSYINASGRPEAFRFPGPEGNEYIPGCAAYEADGNIHIGRAALDFAGDSEVIFCSNLKMILPLKKSEQTAYGWPARKSPEEVIADYLRHLLSLSDGESGSFISQKGEISGLVLSVPHVRAKGMDHAGRSRLQDIVQEKLKLPLIRLISEPVAAAAYYAWQYQKENPRPFCGNLLICDMGGGTFDVTLCRVEPGKVEELYNEGKTGINNHSHIPCIPNSLYHSGQISGL
ncbi:MAG: Hsp70 family protein [Desulfococcaceae bacterium]|jgi:molecular chaperone DnaK|nr:Hsp70 family protein [Desulfococcaceae bacterium]